MPSLRAWATAVGIAAIVGAIGVFWIRWPPFITVASAAVFGLAGLLIASSLEEDDVAADEAWRRASADLDRLRPPIASAPPPPAPPARAGHAGDQPADDGSSPPSGEPT